MSWTLVCFAVRAWFAFAYYELVLCRWGFGEIHRRLTRSRFEASYSREMTPVICKAVNLATCFYFKPVHCLQQSVVTVDMLRESRIPASLVIACRPSPYLAHAYVEVDRKIVNDSPAYAKRLTVLYRNDPQERRKQPCQ